MTTPNSFTRREVLSASAAGIALTVLGGCTDTKKETPAPITTGVVDIGPARDYPAGTVSGKYLAMYGIAIANDSGQVLAIRPICTHKGCVTAWKAESNQFVCPCHESRFNILGQPLSGPAKLPMKGTAAKATPAGTLTVDLDALYRA